MSRFIVIEGLIGVGKTTLCRLLRDHWNASLVLEPVEDNPFLAHFYADKNRYAFPAQMFYLATRCAQQMSLQQGELFSDLIVADYLYEKDRLFAEETLEGHEMALYDRFASLLGASVAVPEFVLFLDASTESVLSRIQRRAIDSEQVIEGSYLESLRERYYALWERYTAAPVYVLNTEGLNYVDDEKAQFEVLLMIQGWLDGTPVAGAPEPYRATSIDQLQLFA